MKRIFFGIFLFIVLVLGYTVGSWLTAALTLVMLVAIGILILSLARLNIFFTIVEEGTAKAIMKMGGFHRIIIQYKGKILDDNGNVVDGYEEHLFGGLRWLGIPFIYSLYKYQFRWKSLRAQSGEIIPNDKHIDYIMLKHDVYVAEIKNAECKGMIPLDITLLITARCVNPYRALFVAQDWMEMLINRSEALFRQYVSEYQFEELIKEKQKAGGRLWERMEEAGFVGDEGLFLKEYGIEIKGIEMRDINPAGESKKIYEENATKQWLAEKEAARIRTLAEAEKDRIKEVYGAVIELGDEGKILQYLEAVRDAGKNPGNWIINFDTKQLFSLLQRKRKK